MTPDLLDADAAFPGKSTWAWSTVRIDHRCTACGSCLVTCPTGALRRAPKRPLVVDERCIACSECIEICPVNAIHEAGSP